MRQGITSVHQLKAWLSLIEKKEYLLAGYFWNYAQQTSHNWLRRGKPRRFHEDALSVFDQIKGIIRKNDVQFSSLVRDLRSWIASVPIDRHKTMSPSAQMIAIQQSLQEIIRHEKAGVHQLLLRKRISLQDPTRRRMKNYLRPKRAYTEDSFGCILTYCIGCLSSSS